MPGYAYHRTPQEVYEGDLLPVLQLGEVETSVRLLAILQVLRRLPRADYERLGALVDKFRWFIPDPDLLGGIEHFPARVPAEEVLSSSALELRDDLREGLRPIREAEGDHDDPGVGGYARVVYLSPELEREGLDVAIAVVALQLAHLAFGHRILSFDDPAPKQVRDADAMVRVWGFGEELDELRRRAEEGGDD